MNKEIMTAEILRCQNVINIYNVDIQTKERELNELYELRKQYEDMEIETEYCINSSRGSLLNDFPTCQSPRFLLSFYQELEMTSPYVDTHRDISYSNAHLQLHSHNFFELIYCCNSCTIKNYAK